VPGPGVGLGRLRPSGVLGLNVPALTLSTRLIEDLGLSHTEMLRSELSHHANRVLEALLVSRGFDLHRLIKVSELPGHDGFVLIQ
jgi:hypothetical protein